MPLRIQKLSWKTKAGVTEGWRLIIETYRKDGKREKSHYPPRHDYPKFGLDPSDSFEKASEKIRTLQAREKLTRDANRKAATLARVAHGRLKESAYLPIPVYASFLEWLQARRMWDSIPDKSQSHLDCMRALILDVNVPPSEWSDKPERVYQWFRTKKYSLSYVDKIRPLLNEYGFFYCRHFKQPFLPVPAPSPDVARRIDDANYTDRGGDGGPSEPMTRKHMPLLDAMPDEKRRWLRLSFFFGLRPDEVDCLTEGNHGELWEFKSDDKGTPYLRIYQSKLIKVERARRWKRIPCILPEQMELREEVLAGKPIERPRSYYVESKLGKGHYLYAGRKGFEKLMRDAGQSFVNISRWLGHKDLSRTEFNYREMDAVDYDAVKGRVS